MFLRKKPEPDEELIRKNRAEIARALEILFAEGYISRRRLYWENFVRGIFFSVGGIIGATLVIALLLWVLSLFDAIPFVDQVRDTIENGSTTVR